jgi:hypothetical protein
MTWFRDIPCSVTPMTLCKAAIACVTWPFCGLFEFTAGRFNPSSQAFCRIAEILSQQENIPGIMVGLDYEYFHRGINCRMIFNPYREYSSIFPRG